MEKTKSSMHIYKWLMPFSYVYGFVVYIRNLLFKSGVLKRKTYNLPIICIGNISVGGTGKTPHTEYIIKLLKDKYRVAVLSRGYKRKSKGFVLASKNSLVGDIGDEPFQMKQKFPEILVAVDKKRTRGIEKLLQLPEPPQVIILDDGFQHRYVKPSYVIILSDHNRPVYEDKLLPAGRLRESCFYLNFASDIIVTKCPDDLLPLDYRIVEHYLNPYPFQGLYFTSFSYASILPIFNKKLNSIPLNSLKDKAILLVTGVAAPKPLVDKISEYTQNIITLQFADHHQFSEKDMLNIKSKFDEIKSSNKIILLTEKDAGRMKCMKITDKNILNSLFYIPIEVKFLKNDFKKEFDKKILAHVKEYSRNS